MDVEYKTVRNTLVVRVKGELDMLIADKMRQEIDRRLEENNIKNLIFNLEKVTFIDSSGLGVNTPSAALPASTAWATASAISGRWVASSSRNDPAVNAKIPAFQL